MMPVSYPFSSSFFQRSSSSLSRTLHCKERPFVRTLRRTATRGPKTHLLEVFPVLVEFCRERLWPDSPDEHAEAVEVLGRVDCVGEIVLHLIFSVERADA